VGGEGEACTAIYRKRCRCLALRLVYFERPDALDDDLLEAMRERLRQRLMAPACAEVLWRSIPAVQRAAAALIASGLEGEALTRQLQYAAYLRELSSVVGE
jgi:hypothetical protein